MSQHTVRVTWRLGEHPFTYEAYPRDHRIVFGTGAAIDASAAAEYRGTPTLPNPEEQLVSALSTCHMLSFLAIAAKRKLTVEAYDDDAAGALAKDAEGRLAITTCVLRPRIRFAAATPVDRALLDKLHRQAHHACFIASSVKTEITIDLGEG